MTQKCLHSALELVANVAVGYAVAISHRLSRSRGLDFTPPQRSTRALP